MNTITIDFDPPDEYVLIPTVSLFFGRNRQTKRIVFWTIGFIFWKFGMYITVRIVRWKNEISTRSV